MTLQPKRPAFPLWLRLIMGVYTAALLSYMGMGLFSRMMADDFCTAAIGNRLNPIAATQEWYRTWSGLYTNFLIKSAIAPFEPALNSFVTALFILGILVVLWRVLRDVLRWYTIASAGWIALLLSGLLTFGLVDGAVSRQSIFWAGALIPYSLPLILIVGAAGVAFHLIFTAGTRTRQIVLTLAFALLVFLIAGLSEIYAVYEGAIWGLLLVAGTFVLAREQRHRTWGVMGLALVVTAIGLIVVLKSPGNEIRRAQQDQSLLLNNPLELMQSVLEFASAIFTLETYGIMHFFLAFFGSLGVWLWAIANGQDADHLPAPRRLGQAAVLSFLAGFALVCVAVTPPMYGAGLVAARALMPVRFTQILLFALWGYWAAVGLARAHVLHRMKRSPSYRLVTAALLSAFLLIPTIVLLRHAALVGNFATYARQWDARHASLIAAHAAGQTPVLVTPLDYNIEEYLLLDRLEKAGTATDAAWMYGCVTSYYGVDVTLLNPPEIVNPEKK